MFINIICHVVNEQQQEFSDMSFLITQTSPNNIIQVSPDSWPQLCD